MLPCRQAWYAYFSDLLKGSSFVLPSPKPREKSDELKARLEKLREIQERKEYAELVRDVVPPSKDDAPKPFSSYKDQIGFAQEMEMPCFKDVFGSNVDNT